MENLSKGETSPKKIIYLQDENYNWKEFQFEKIEDLTQEFFKREIKIGAGSQIGAWSEIGAGSQIGAWSKIGEGSEIGAGSKIGEGSKITKYNALFSNSLYDYAVSAYINKNGQEVIQLGCYSRLRKEWEANFWNNINEFPNNGSEKSNARLRAFKVSCFFLDQLKEVSE